MHALGYHCLMNEINYTEVNSKAIDKWVKEGWIWSQSISHEAFVKAQQGQWSVLLTPTKPVPHSWLGDLRGKRLLGLASAGGQQMPIFCALGAICTVLDYSDEMLAKEREVAAREDYSIEIIKADMTKPLGFEDESFDIIFHPVSNCYVKQVLPIWRECHRILRKGGVLLCGLDNGINFAFTDDESELANRLPYDPLENRRLLEEDDAIEFSHTIEEQLDGQIRAGFTFTNIEGDTNQDGRLASFNIHCFYMTRAVK